MRYVSVITDYTYLLWQQELQIYNLMKLGQADDLTVVILTDPGKEPSDHAKRLCKLAEVKIYENAQDKRHYIPSNKPYGVMRLLEEHPEYGERLFLLDSDVIFREPIDFSKLDDEHWYVSDSGVIGFIGWDYVKQALGEDAEGAAAIVGIDPEVLKENQRNSGGAQYFMKGVTADFARKCYQDSIAIYDYMRQFKKEDGTPKIQIWTAEMWSWLWNALMTASVRVHPELNFTWAPHHVNEWERFKMLHLAGIVSTTSHTGAFFKGKYTHRIPWEDPELLDGMSPDLMTWKYLELMMEYREHLSKRG